MPPTSSGQSSDIQIVMPNPAAQPVSPPIRVKSRTGLTECSSASSISWFGRGGIDHQVPVPPRPERPDRVGRRVHVDEGGQDARRAPGALDEGHQWCPPARFRGIGIISLISWIATIGKLLANSRNHIENQPNEPSRMPQSAQVVVGLDQAQGM